MEVETVLSRLELYTPPRRFPGDVQEAYSARAMSNTANPETFEDTFIADLMIMARYNGIARKHASTAVYLYRLIALGKTRGYKHRTHYHFVNSLSVEDLVKLEAECRKLIETGRDYWGEEIDRRLSEFPESTREEMRAHLDEGDVNEEM